MCKPRICLLMSLFLAPVLFCCSPRGTMPVPQAGTIPFTQDGQSEPVIQKTVQPGPVYTSPKATPKKAYKRRVVKRKAATTRPKTKTAIKRKSAPKRAAQSTPPIPLPLTEKIQPEPGDRLGIYEHIPDREPEPLQ